MRLPRALAPTLALLILLSLAALSGCYRAVDISPSLAPVDTSQPIVRYKAIQGSACTHWVLYLIPTGGDLTLEALLDMKRLVNVDGYLEVSVEERTTWWLLGYSTCVTATGYPFTYGTEVRQLQLRGAAAPPPAPPVATAPRPPPSAQPPPAPVAAPPPAPGGPTQVECNAACERLGRLAGATATIQNVVAGKCRERCYQGDQRYYDCVTQARTGDDVKQCNSLR